ncbi:MAG: beta-N-acetylhexosaminidase [Rickettsiales bacterium]|nr:beta-N-acetylhexosaminidase [Rickettsiales bacterium]
MKRAVLGISGLELTPKEIDLFKEHQPFGVILFKRNCKNEDQLKALTSSIKVILPKSKIFIDQEGGRVARLKEPNFKEFPAADSFSSEEEVYNNYFIMGKYLHSLGIDVNCAPVADIHYSFAHKVIGDRSFGENVEQVVKFARAAAQGLIDGGIIPIIKHIPGHGRALVDSHLKLPVVDSDLKTLAETDFAVFKALNNLPMAMTAHVIFNALDTKLPVTISKKSVDYIRKEIGFEGALISDAIEMKALEGNFASLSTQVLEAGCDLVLHCTGELNEMKEVLESVG